MGKVLELPALHKDGRELPDRIVACPRSFARSSGMQLALSATSRERKRAEEKSKLDEARANTFLN